MKTFNYSQNRYQNSVDEKEAAGYEFEDLSKEYDFVVSNVSSAADLLSSKNHRLIMGKANELIKTGYFGSIGKMKIYVSKHMAPNQYSTEQEDLDIVQGVK